MEQQNRLFSDDQHEENEISIVELIFHYLKYWKWIVLSIVVAATVAFIYLRYTAPVYNVSSIVMLKHVNSERRGVDGLGSLDALELMGSVNNMENETCIMRSEEIVRIVVDRLNLHTSYLQEGYINQTDMYNDSPFIIAMDDDELNSLRSNISFVAQLNKDKSISVRGTIGDKEYDTKLSNLPGILSTPHGIISFTMREGVEPYFEPLYINIERPLSTVSSYIGSLSVKPVDKTSVMNLSFKTSYPKKGIDFLNTLMEVYNFKTMADKNLEATNTKDFITDRLNIIDYELSIAESAVEEYKLRKGMSDIDLDLRMSMQQSNQYEQQLVKTETQLNIVNVLDEYVRNPENQNRSISNIGVQDPALAATVNEYNKLLAERERLSKSLENNNPVMQKMKEQIEGLRTGINQYISSMKEGLIIECRNIANKANIYSGKVGEVPTRERQFAEIARELEVKTSLYMLLLEKREENALALAATTNSGKMLNKAAIKGIVHPKRQIILLASLLLGLLIPIGIIYLMGLLQYKIKTWGDVERISKLPMLGSIPSYDTESKGNIAVMENGTTELDEAFRVVRTNLILSLDHDDKVIVFTSTAPNEGKSFAALNTAISLALLGKRVLLLGLDFRIPQVSQYLGLDNETGITHYLSGYEEDIMKLARPTHINENLMVMPSGPVPPNPSELLSRDSLDIAIDHLRPQFDYIIVDSAPVSYVTDTFILNRIADATAYLCRANYTNKTSLKYANDLMTNDKLKNMLLLINDVTDSFNEYGYGYGYGNSYSYRYRYGYGQDASKRSEKKKQIKGKDRSRTD